jgi:hypothetical protein
MQEGGCQEEARMRDKLMTCISAMQKSYGICQTRCCNDAADSGFAEAARLFVHGQIAILDAAQAAV